MPEEAGGTAEQIEDEPFYHGFMSHDECKPLLTYSGDFLIRRAEIDGEMQYVITVLPENSDELTNFVIKKTRSVSDSTRSTLIQHTLIIFCYIYK